MPSDFEDLLLTKVRSLLFTPILCWQVLQGVAVLPADDMSAGLPCFRV